jgi:hypothetical protein
MNVYTRSPAVPQNRPVDLSGSLEANYITGYAALDMLTCLLSLQALESPPGQIRPN